MDRDQLILDEIERLSALASWVALTLEEQDGRILLLESTRYWRLATIAGAAGLLGALVGAVITWGACHV